MKEVRNGLIEDLGAIMGTEAALRMIAIWGGSQLYIPANAGEEHPIARLVGDAAFKRLQGEFGGEILSIPINSEFARLERVRRVARAIGLGLRTGDIAQLFGMSQRQIIHYRRQAEDLCLIPAILDSRTAGRQGDKWQMFLGEAGDP